MIATKEEEIKQGKPKRVRLNKEAREKLIRSYIERKLAREEKLPSQQELSKTIGGNIYSILEILREYREKR
jgi:DNA-binding FadR family transcriptional regulator